MTRRNTMRQPKLLNLLLLASTTSATMITLSGFETIETLSVPLSCIFAYNTPILGCAISDFAQGYTCSGRCERGLARVQDNIQASCASVEGAPGSLLYDAQRGMLVKSVCGDRSDGGGGTTLKSMPASTPASTPEPQPSTLVSTPTTSAKPASTEETTTSTATSTMTRSLPAPSTTSPSPSNSPSSSEVSTARNTPTSTAVTSNSSAKPTPTTISRVSSTDARYSVTPTTAKTEGSRQTLLPGSGGGSPFDFVAGGEAVRAPGVAQMAGAIMAVVGLMLV